jgi:hypothetical protein
MVADRFAREPVRPDLNLPDLFEDFAGDHAQQVLLRRGEIIGSSQNFGVGRNVNL